MKQKLTFLFFILILGITLSAQHISVESFRMLENDMDARVNHPKRDQNGEVAALIKVITTETGFSWEAGMLGIVNTEQKVAEIWVYVPPGSQRITIKHPKLGQLRNYAYPIAIEAATVYEMRLTTARIEINILEPEAETQWLVVTSEPDGADVYIENIHKGQTPVQMELNTGTYSYRIEKPLYHSSAGRVTLTTDKRETIDTKLNPNYGYIKVTTTPESGAEITINGNKLQQTTPHTSDRMPAGEYQITVSKSMFHSETRNITIGEGKTEELAITMKPDFGLLRVITNPEPGAEVTINGNRHSSTTPFTTERLRAGDYEIAVTMTMYHPEIKKVTIGDGKTTEVVFDLRPSFGEVSVTTKPETGAEVLVNSISTGKKTPCNLDRLPTGQHQITVRKEWYQPKTIAVDITDGLSDHFEIEMEPTFGILNVTAEHDAQIFVNDDRKATAQWDGRLIAGWYTVEARKDKYHSDQKRVEIKLAETQNLSLHPKPMTGAIKIQTTPFDAAITINGKDHGKTPNTIRDMLIGEYTIVLTKQGYAAVTHNVTIVENETAEINETLPAGMSVTITSEPAGAELYINNQKVGNTPYTDEFSFGDHNIKLVNRSKTLEETINVKQDGQNRFSFDVAEIVVVTIESKPTGAELFINNEKIGTTPYSGELRLGNHLIKLVNNTKIIEETISLKQNGLSSFIYDVEEFNNPFKNLMVFVKGGSFEMGCKNEPGCQRNAKPKHTVQLSDFYISKYEVTVEQFKQFIDDTKYVTEAERSGYSTAWHKNVLKKVDGVYWKHNEFGNLRPEKDYNHPIIHVSWEDAMEFCKWLSLKTGKNYRLPTEAEWEYAARGGQYNRGFQYSGSHGPDDVAWYWRNSGDKYLSRTHDIQEIRRNNSKSHPVGQLKPNELGLYDMIGNVWEICYDWYDPRYYKNSPTKNPKGPSSGQFRVARGGSHLDGTLGLSVFYRPSEDPEMHNLTLCALNVGFRVVREVDN